MELLNLFTFVSVFVCSVNCGRILAVFPYPGKSHFFPFKEVLLALAKRGHDVTVISQFPQTTRQEHYTDIDIRGIGRRELAVNISEMVETGGLTLKRAWDEIQEFIVSFEKVFDSGEVKRLINSNTKFDVVWTEILVTDMFVGFAHRCGAQLIELSSTNIPPMSTDRFGIPDNPSYIRLIHHTDTYSKQMSFFERMYNTFGYVLFKSLYPIFMASNDERVNKKHLGSDMPTVKEIVMNRSSLFLVNTHFSLTGALPIPPTVIEIGGAHIKPIKPLPQDIEKFINESEHGAIYFSLGSIANLSSMSDTMRKAFIGSFAKLKQRVLWKWEVDEMPDKPDNVKIVKWMPQNDVLAHPKVKVFIGHGGLLGTMEGVYHAVPMIGIPLFADQFQNIENLVNAGMAESLDFRYITEEAVTKALTAVLEDPKYKMNADKMSKLFRDRPLSALDTAVYWVEYVIRHKGAHHLRSAAVHLPWYQYLLLDVIAALILLFVVVVTILVYVFKLVFRLVCGKKKEKVQ